MKTTKALLVLAAASLLFAPPSEAQTKAGLTGASFLKVGVGARAVAMGSAATALRGDVNQMFWNPAGITLTDDMLQASFSYNRWIADLAHNSAAVSYRLDDIGTIGIGFISFGVSGIPADRDAFSNPVLQAYQVDQATSATYDYLDMAVQVAFARNVTDNLSLGVNLKYINQSIDDQSASAVAVDFGSVYQIGVMDWTIAARLSNLGSDMQYYDIAFGLPLTFSIGTALSPFTLGEQSKLTVAVDAVKGQDGPQYFYSGMEYAFSQMIFVRLGYKLNYSGTDNGGTSVRPAVKTTIEGLSAGAGFMTTLMDYGIRVDYSYTQMEILDAAHRFSLSVSMK